MNYEEFLNEARENLTARLASGNPGLRIEITEVEKLQGMSYRGLMIREDGSRTGMSMDLSPFFDRVENGEDKRTVLEGVAREVHDRMADQPVFNVALLQDYDRMKENLSIQMIPIRGNENLLELIPHETMEDLAAVYRFRVGEDGYVLLRNDLLDIYGITDAQLKADAARFAPERDPAVIRSMMEMMMSIAPAGMEMPGAEPPIYVAATTAQTYGAGVLAYPGFHEMAAEQMKGDYFILPSSIHEVLLVPDNGDMNWHELEAMVQTVNATTVAPEERLSDHVYHYDSKEKVFELAGRYEARMADREKSAAGLSDRRRPSQEKGGRKSVLEELKHGRPESRMLHADHMADKASRMPSRGEAR